MSVGSTELIKERRRRHEVLAAEARELVGELVNPDQVAWLLRGRPNLADGVLAVACLA